MHRVLLPLLVLASCDRVFSVPVDEIAVCGDQMCSGQLGESCLSCAVDCDTVEGVCGNQICDATEAANDSCFDDCGPTDWPASWSEIEVQIATRIGALRAKDTCGFPPAPPLVHDDGIQRISRNQAWDAAHHDYLQTGADSVRCNGVSLVELLDGAGYPMPHRWMAHRHTTLDNLADNAIDFWVDLPDACDALMDARFDRFGVGHAEERRGDDLVVWSFVVVWQEP